MVDTNSSVNRQEDDQGEAEGIDGTGLTSDIFSKQLPDDCVEYTIIVIDERIKTRSELRERLRAIQDAASDLSKKYLKEYIWQRDDFKLSFHHEIRPLEWTLRGNTNFGDSIADEWLIVWLLRSLSTRFPEAWIRLEDTDGEFLLVEAANKLPKWLNPEIADHRVWIREGKLVIIPLSSGDEAPQSSNLSLEQAVKFLSESSADVLHDQNIEDEAFFRLKAYPDAIKTTLHRAKVRIPRRLAYILHQQPAYISPAIEAFYLRDPISLKPLVTKDIGTLLFAPKDFVTVSTTFTRVGYAQLRSQDFPFPPSWTDDAHDLENPEVSTGMKLTCGFEMLLQDKTNRDKRAVREINLLLSDLDAGDDELPSDAEISRWDHHQDDEKWLDIGFEDLERELRGERNADKKEGEQAGFGDAAQQANLRRLVDRFQEFMADEKAGPEGVEDSDAESTSSDSDSDDDSEADDKAKLASVSEDDFQTSMRKVHDLSATDTEHQDLAVEARKLALEMEDEDEGTRDEDAEAAEVMKLAEQIRAARKAASTQDGRDKGKELAARAHSSTQKGFIAGKPPIKPGDSMALSKKVYDSSDEEDYGTGDYELSSDEDDGENDVDLDLLRNVLRSFSGQQGMGGPAGNVLANLGIRMPRDEELGRKK
ncbi:hypothetical protein ANO11243_012270 [Dothideomycetidae sp. 11243]|nr:hypothetical protein ANO11243_012270 [fungal sp. No.11243]